MQNTKITDGNLLPNEVKVGLNVLGALMLHRVGGHVDGTNVIIVHQCGAPKRGMQLQEKRQIAAATPLATARYSASTLDLDAWRTRKQKIVAKEHA